MCKDELQQGEGVSLFGYWMRLWDKRLQIVVAVALGLACAVLVIVMTQPRYEAAVVLQVGVVGQGIQNGQPIGVPVEPPGLAVQRLRTHAFQQKAAETIEDQAWNADLRGGSSNITKDLSAQVLKATEVPGQIALIEIKAAGSSPEIAAKRARAAVTELVRVQDELAKPLIKRMEGELAVTMQRLANTERDADELNKQAVKARGQGEQFTVLPLLLTNLRQQKNAEVFNLRQSVRAMEAALQPPATQPAKTIEDIFASDKPVSPKKTMLLVLGALGGLLVGGMWVYIGYSFRRPGRLG